jgi:hypothetical protein
LQLLLQLAARAVAVSCRLLQVLDALRQLVDLLVALRDVKLSHGARIDTCINT